MTNRSPLFSQLKRDPSCYATQLNSDTEDRCGIKGLSTANDPFLPACKRHDHNYVLMGSGGGLTRKQVDDELLRDMKIICKQTGKWWLLPKAYVYYGIARTVGYFFWD